MLPDYTPLEQATRRHFLSGSGVGLGAIALSSLTGSAVTSGSAVADIPIRDSAPLEQRQPHHAGKAKQVIYLHLTGSPPNLDIYDYKPALVARTGPA